MRIYKSQNRQYSPRRGLRLSAESATLMCACSVWLRDAPLSAGWVSRELCTPPIWLLCAHSPRSHTQRRAWQKVCFFDLEYLDKIYKPGTKLACHIPYSTTAFLILYYLAVLEIILPARISTQLLSIVNSYTI